MAAVVGLGSAALVFIVLRDSALTDCYQASVKISIAYSKDNLRGCPFPAFDAVRQQVSEQRTLAKNNRFVPDEPDPVKGNATLLVWMALFSATAGLAGISAVRSTYTIVLDMKPRPPTLSIVRSGIEALLIVLVPYVLLRKLSDWTPLTPFDDLHLTLIRWLSLFVLVLILPAATGLRVARHILGKHPALTLNDAAKLGSQLRNLIGMLGGIVSLAVFAHAARWQAIASLPAGESLPGTVILLWGAVYALALAALYVPVYERWSTAAWRTISLEVSRQYPPADATGTIGYSVAELSAKKALQTDLGLGSALGTLQGPLAVLAPIIAGAASSLFS